MALRHCQTGLRNCFASLLFVTSYLASSASLQSSLREKLSKSSLLSFESNAFAKQFHLVEERPSSSPTEDRPSITHLPLHAQIYDVPLDNNDTFHLYWQVDYSSEHVRMEVHSRATSPNPWLALGFSDRGNLEGSDMCIFWVDWKKKVHFQNAVVDKEGRLRLFSSQACLNFRYRIREGILKFTFTRYFDPCTPDHYIIERGTTHLVWSWGQGPLYDLEGVLARGDYFFLRGTAHLVWSWGQGPLYDLEGVLARGDYEGEVKIELLKPDLPKPSKENVNELLVMANKVSVPAEETTYWCSVQKLPEQFVEKHHMVEFGSKIQKENEDIVHHMEVFHCEHPPDFIMPLYQGPCHSPTRRKEIDACKRVMAAWAMGATNFAYPDEAGLPIGGKDFNQYIMLEVHYNNPSLFEGRVDSSGIRISYVSKLRRYDAAIMELGLEYSAKMAIPPAMKSFVLAGYCIPECTALGLNPEGIHIFGSQLHTHLTGVRVWTKHYRDDAEMPEMNRDNHYSTHFQEIRRLPEPVHVLPGDSLITACEYSTPDRVNVTVGGFAISDEMCVNYVHYYPKVDLEVCKSSVDSKTLQDYFDFMHRLELQPTSKDLSWRENYNVIEWTPLRSTFLQNMYEEAPLSMQCNRSSGERFPGFWENKPIPRVHHLLPEAERKCAKEILLPEVDKNKSLN